MEESSKKFRDDLRKEYTEFVLYPMLPRQFSRKQREEIKRKEKEILLGKHEEEER